MLKNRLIPLLLYKNGLIVKSRQFKFFQTVGNPFDQVKRYNLWNLDELLYLNISGNDNFEKNFLNITSSTSSGKNYLNNKLNVYDFVKKLSQECFMPLTYGGGIKTVKQAVKILKHGADKISINTAAFRNKKLIKECSMEFGSQSLVISIDYKTLNDNNYVHINNGKINTDILLEDWVKIAEDNGAGEILLNAIDRDGVMNGYDLGTIKKIQKLVSIPIVACGGAGSIKDFGKLIDNSDNCIGLAAANIFQFTENSYQNIKKDLKQQNYNIR